MALSQLSFIGTNVYGQCPLPAGSYFIRMPAAALLDWLPVGKRVLKVVVGFEFTLLLADDNLLFAVGYNAAGQLGRGHSNADDPDNRVPRPVTGFGLERITQIAAGRGHCAAVTEGGKLLLWGRNGYGQCGTGTAGGSVLAATRCDSGALADVDLRVVFVACGGYHTMALTSDGGVIAFGDNGFGQLGTSNNDTQLTPERLACAVLDGVRIVGCAAGASFTQLVSDDGRVFAMGQNNYGQLGTGDTTNVNTPTEIDAAHFGGAPVAAVACGVEHTLVITRGEGKLYCWGNGAYGRTGLGHMDDATTPQSVVGALADARVVRIAGGLHHSCALAEDGRLFAFGGCGGIPAAGQQGTPQLLQEGALAAGATVCALGAACFAQHAAFIVGAPPTEPGFEAPLAFAMQKKPAPKVPKHAAAAAAAPPAPAHGQEGGGGATANLSTASEHGTKRKRDSQGDDDDNSALEDGSANAAPLC
jgi:alpha-tubulin suppressor-like RCC1 family protein